MSNNTPFLKNLKFHRTRIFVLLDSSFEDVFEYSQLLIPWKKAPHANSLMACLIEEGLLLEELNIVAMIERGIAGCCLGGGSRLV